MNPMSSLVVKTFRFRGAAAAPSFFSCASGERRCVVPSSSVSSFGTLGRVFVSAARTPLARTAKPSRVVEARGSRAGVPALRFFGGVAPLAQWQAIKLISFVSCSPLCSAEVAA